MFRSSLNRILDWAENALAPVEEDWGVGEDQEEGLGEGRSASVQATPHPHRRELRWERKRRPGSLPPRPAHCISPVRGKAGQRTRQDSAR
jgi:hypothetical protein